MAKIKSNYYFDEFVKGISFADEAAEKLQGYFEDFDGSNVKEQLEELHKIEHTADEVKHEMMERLVKEFLPPIEREDIVELAHCIDDVTDCIEDIMRRLYMYNIKFLHPEVNDFMSVIVRSCKALVEATKELPNFRKSEVLRKQLIAVNDLEEEGDNIYTEAVHKLYTEETDPIAVQSWSIMYDCLEKCCDSCEHVADMIEQIIMKNS